MMPDLENTHVCRDFDAIHAWLKSRDSADPRVWRDNAMRILAASGDQS